MSFLDSYRFVERYNRLTGWRGATGKGKENAKKEINKKCSSCKSYQISMFYTIFTVYFSFAVPPFYR